MQISFCDTKESESNMFNPIIEENVQGQKHPGRYVVADPDLPSHKKPKYVVQNEWNGHKNLNNRRNHQELVKETQIDTQPQNSAVHPHLTPHQKTNKQKKTVL